MHREEIVSSMEGWRDQGKWLLRRQDFAGHPVDDSVESMMTALVRAAQSKHQGEALSRVGESREPAATAPAGPPRKGEIPERPGGSNKSVVGNPGRAGGKRKATEETLSGEDGRRRGRSWKEVAEEGIGFPAESRDREWSLGEEKSCGKHQGEVSSCVGESCEPAATAPVGTPRKGEILERPGGSNKLVAANPGRAGGKRKATEETLSGEDGRRCGRSWKEVAKEGIGFPAESRHPEWNLGEKKSCGTGRKVSGKKSPASPPGGPPADMPREFKDRIDRMGGKEVKLVIEKELSRTDMDRHICRLSIPKSQVRDPSFLGEEESRVGKARNAIDVSVIGPRREGELKFALLEMGGRSKANPSLIYIFRSGWNDFASENKLRAGDRIQIWSFRVDSDGRRNRLFFALVNLDDGRNGNNNGSNPSSVPGSSSSEHGSTSTPKKD